MRRAEPTFTVGFGAHAHAVRTLRNGEWSIHEIDREGWTVRVLDHAMRDGSEPAVMCTEAADHDQMRIDLCGECDDLFMRTAGANVKARVPFEVALAECIEAFEHERRELVLRSVDVIALVDDMNKVKVRRAMTCRLIERMLEHDLGILREVERDDQAKMRLVHDPRCCIGHAARIRDFRAAPLLPSSTEEVAKLRVELLALRDAVVDMREDELRILERELRHELRERVALLDGA